MCTSSKRRARIPKPQRLRCILLCFLLWLAPRAAMGEPVALVLALEPRVGTERVRARTEDELRAAGFFVRGEAERAEDAVAVVRLARRTSGPEGSEWTIAVEDRVTGKRIERPAQVGRDEDESARVALLALELLYASWLELRISPAPRGSVPAPPAVTRAIDRRLAMARRLPRWGVHAGGGLLVAPGAIGRPAAVELGASWLEHALGLELVGWLTPGTQSVVTGDASARLRLGALRLGALLSPVRHARLAPAFTLGAGVLFVSARGRALAPLKARSETGVVGFASGSAGLAYRIYPGLRLRASSALGLAMTEVRIRIAGEEATRVGLPLLELHAGGEGVFR